jgi:hypothetical protein
MRTASILASVVLLLNAPARNLGASPGQLSGSSSFDYVMMGMKDGRDRLRSGVFRAYGMYSDMDSALGVLRGNVEIFCAFDGTSDSIRFDRSLPVRMALSPEELKQATKPSQSWKISKQRTKLILTRKELLVTDLDSHLMTVLTAQDLTQAVGRPFDVRTLGLLYWTDFDKYVRFDDFFLSLSHQKPREVNRQSDGRWKIVWEMFGTQRTLWVDESSGFAPIRSETRFLSKKGNSKAWAEPRYISEVTWVKHSDVWVPKTFRLENHPSPESPLSYDLSFEWESVNSKIPDAYFKKEGLEIQDRTVVMDLTTGRPVITDVLNDNHDYASYHSSVSSQNSVLSRRSKIYRLVLANVAGVSILILVYVMYVRRRAAKRA